MSTTKVSDVTRVVTPSRREELIQRHLRLVRRAVSRVRSTMPQTVEDGDLVGYGLLGLLEAVDRFDPTRGVPFEAYAFRRIHGAIMDGLRLMGWLPRGMYQRAKKLSQAIAALEEQLNRPPGEEEIAAHLNVSVQDYEIFLQEAAPVTLLPWDETVPLCPEDGQDDVWTHLELEELRQAVTHAVEALPEKERLVITLYFYETMTLKEIATILKVTEGRACQIKTQALLRLDGVLRKGGW